MEGYDDIRKYFGVQGAFFAKIATATGGTVTLVDDDESGIVEMHIDGGLAPVQEMFAWRSAQRNPEAAR